MTHRWGRLKTWIPPLSVRIGRSPADELMKASATCDELISRTQQQVIGVHESMISAPASSRSEVPDGLDRSLSADWHEGRRLKDAVRRLAFAKTCSAIGRSHA